MTALLSLLPLLCSIILLAGFVKLSARLYRNTVVSWRHSFVFAVLLFSITFAKIAINLTFGEYFPIAVGLVLGVGWALGIGTWYFSSRAKTAEGVSLGWRKAFKFTAIFVSFLLIFSFSMLKVLKSFLPAIS